MNQHTKKLEQQQKQQTTETKLTEQKTAAREFSSVEEMLRFDAAQTQVPSSIEVRLAESVQKELAARKARPWWKKLFG